MKKLLLLFFSVFALQANAQTYCSAGPSSTIDSEITGVVLIGNTDTISNLDSNCGTTGVQDFTSTYSADISRGATYTVSVTMGTCGGTYSGAIAAWIDFNDDGDFTDAGEQLGSWGGSPTVTQSFQFTVPGNASLGSTRMRVMQQEGGSATGILPCNTFSWGAVEDYEIIIDTLSSPTCLAPTFSSMFLLDTAIGLTWNSSDTTFVIEYGATGFINGLGTQVTVHDTFAIITGLSSNTSYDFYIKTDCTADTNGYSTTIGPFTGQTLCSAVSTPLYESFENDSTGGFSNPNAPACWYYAENPGAAGYGYISTGGWSLSPYNGSQCYYLYNSYDSAVEALISPAIMGLDSGEKQMELYMANSGWSTGNDVIVGTVSGPAGLSSFHAIDTLSVPNGNTWTQYTVYFDSLAGYNMVDLHIAIVSTTTSTYNAVYIDEITISDAPQCLPPTALSMGTIGADSAQVNFTTNGIASYIEYGPVGFVPNFSQSTGTMVTASSSPHWLTSLDTNTSYDVYVYQMCADSTVSPAFGPVTFKTLQCAPADMCTYDIELTDSYGDGWNGALAQVLNSSGGVEYTLGSGFLNGSTYTETIMVCTGETFTIQVSNAGSYPSEIGLNVISNGSTTTSYAASSSTTLGTQMATFTSSCNTSCPTPGNLTYIAGKNDATFTFDQNGGTATYMYEWGPVGFAQSTGASVSTTDSTTTNTFSITGLTASTCYDVLIIADCGASGVSDTLGPITFCTNLCDTTDLCDWTMLMEDSYGDGWNGAEVSVLFNGVFAQSFTFTSGSSDTAHFQVCSGTEITVVNTQAGFYPSEVSYTLSSNSGTASTSVSQNNFAVGVQDTLYANCVTVSCPMPTNLSVSNVGPTSVDVSWTGGTGTFMYDYRAQGSTATMSGTSTTALASLTGLVPSTMYDFFIKEACGPGDTSLTYYYTFETDTCLPVTIGSPQFTVDSVNATSAAVTFNWTGANFSGYSISFGDGNMMSGTGGTIGHSYTANGTYTVSLTLYSDCDTATSSFNVQIGTIGVEENMGISALMIFPNPTQGLVTINGEIHTDSDVNVRIVNYLGQEIVNEQFDPNSTLLNKTYDLSGAAAGAYLIEVATESGVAQKTIIVRH